MRFKSQKKDGLHVFTMAGVNTVSFGITASHGRCKLKDKRVAMFSGMSV